MGARRLTSAGLVSLCALVGLLALAAVPAFAAPPEKPVTEAVTEITASTATFNGELNPGASKEKLRYLFVYEEGSFPENCGPLNRVTQIPEAEGNHKKVSIPVTSLEGSAKYTVCLFAENEEIGAVGNSVEFTTLPAKPEVVGESASVKAASATLGARVNPENEPTTCVFEYGALAVSENVVPCEPAVLKGASASASLSVPGLIAGAKYHYRVVVENEQSKIEGKPVMGKEEEFTTPIPPETPEKQKASEVTASSAKINGVLNPKGAGSAGTYEFLYKQSATECAGGGKAPEPAGSSTGVTPEPVSAVVMGLLPATKYTFCLLVRNAGEEEAVGPPETFETLATAPTIEEAFVTNVSAEGAVLHARLNPGGADTTYRFEDAVVGGEYAPVRGPGGESLVGAEGDAGAGVAPVSLEVGLSGLSPSASYRFRLVASSSVLKTLDGPEGTLTTQGSGEFALPDARRWEMVSPPNKLGALIAPLEAFAPGGTIVQAAAGGGAVSYVASTPIESGPAGYTNELQVLSTRASTGWSSANIAIPHASETGSGVLGNGQEYRLFSADLSSAVVQPFGPFTPCTDAQGAKQPCLSEAASEQTAFLHNLQSGVYTPLVTAKEGYANDTANPFAPFGLSPYTLKGGTCPPVLVCGPRFRGATSDLSHVVFQSIAPLTQTTPVAGKGGLYEYSAGQLTLVSVLPEGTPASGGLVLGMVEHGGSTRHAISEDGSRVIFTYEEHLYLRENAWQPQSPVSAGKCTVPADACTVQLDSGLSGQPLLQTADREVSEVFFTDGHSGEELDLYKYDVELGEPVRLTEGAKVRQNVIGASEDGSYLYFVADGQLAPGAVPGGTWGSNLYVRHNGETRLVAVLSGEDHHDWGRLNGMPARVSPDGEWLAFMSQRSLTGYDNRDAVSGLPDQEVYLYSASTGALSCASCDPTGARSVGVEFKNNGLVARVPVADSWVAGSVPGWLLAEGENAVYQPRYLSNDGRLYFDSSDALVPLDVNGTEDVYQYEPGGVPTGEHACSPSSASGSVVYKPAHGFEVEGRKGEEGAGCVGLISSGSSAEESAFLDASETGGDVFFLTAARLAPQDYDTSLDVYDAHECASSSPCVPAPIELPPACTTEASCRLSPTSQPSIYGLPSSATFSGPGDSTQLSSAPPKKVAKKTVRCRRRFAKHGNSKCVRKKARAGKSTHRKGNR